MENSLLNQAHIAGNQALKFQSQGLYDSAIERHLLAADLLSQLQAKLPCGNNLVNSLSYFIDFHKRQAELDEVILNFNKKGKTADPTSVLTMNTKSLQHSKTVPPLVPSIRRPHERKRIFEEPDSLLPHSCSTSGTKYTVRPKSDSEIIEEYKVNINNLKCVVAMQAEELMELRKKGIRDDDTIRELRRRLEKYEPRSSILTASASQYIPASIPELPPLELPPDCDFTI